MKIVREFKTSGNIVFSSQIKLVAKRYVAVVLFDQKLHALHFISFCNPFLCTSCDISYALSEINKLELGSFLLITNDRHNIINLICKQNCLHLI